MMTDNDARTHVAVNVQALLEKAGKSTYWLMKETGELPNRIYPVVKGEAMASVGLLSRIAEALGVPMDALIEKPSKKNLEKFPVNHAKSA